MTGKLPPTASVANSLEGAKLHAPAAQRNTDVLSALVKTHAPARGEALEIASGTGQHVIAFAQTMPDLVWQPSDVDAARIASINAYAAEAGLENVKPARLLNATKQGWRAVYGKRDLVVLINLLHLIPAPDAQTLVTEAVSALNTGGRFILYGPFMRSGELTSAGDARFHRQLTDANPAIGYKDDATVEDWLWQAGAASVERAEMPANNLAFIATR